MAVVAVVAVVFDGGGSIRRFFTKQATLRPSCPLITAVMNTDSVATVSDVVPCFAQVPSICLCPSAHIRAFTELSLFSLRNMSDERAFFFFS